MKLLTGVFVSVVLLIGYSMSDTDSGTSTSMESTNSDLKLMNQLLERNTLSSSSSFEEEENKSHKRKQKPPQYIKHLLEQFKSSHTPMPDEGSGQHVAFKIHDRTFTQPRNRLFYAWLPAEIKEDDGETTVAIFQQNISRERFGKFTACHITLTLQQEADFDSGTYISMLTHWQNNVLQQELIQTLPIVKGKKFYSFVITEFIASCLQQNVSEPYSIKISFQVFASHNRGQMLDFARIFDVQVDLPIIVFFYRNFVPAENYVAKQQANRRPRSLTVSSKRPSCQCKREQFVVTPADVDWFTIVEPAQIDLGYCNGTCPFPLQDPYYNFTFHTFLLDRFRIRRTFDVPIGFPRSTCTPVTYKAISVLEEVDVDQYDAVIVQNISVDTCGCR